MNLNRTQRHFSQMTPSLIARRSFGGADAVPASSSAVSTTAAAFESRSMRTLSDGAAGAHAATVFRLHWSLLVMGERGSPMGDAALGVRQRAVRLRRGRGGSACEERP